MNAFFEIVKYAFIVLLLLILAISYVYEEYLPRYNKVLPSQLSSYYTPSKSQKYYSINCIL